MESKRSGIGSVMDEGRGILDWKKIIVVVLVIAIVAGGLFSLVTVQTGYRGVLLTFNAATGSLNEGLNFVIPFVQSVVMMEVRTQKYEATADAASKDLQSVTATVAVNYHVDPGSVVRLYQEIGIDYQNRIITPSIQESVKASTAKFTAEELITRREDVKKEMMTVLYTRLQPYGIIVEAVNIVNFQFSEAFNAAIEAKVTAEQRALEAKNKLEQIRYEAQQQVIQAQAYYNATILTAQGDAEAMRLRNQALTPLIIEWMALQQWDGSLPYFWSGGALPFIQIPINGTNRG